MSFISNIRPLSHPTVQHLTNSPAAGDSSAMAIAEPPSCGCSIVLIGQNSRGQWVAQEQHALFGGLFVHRAAALSYALFENGHHPEAIVEIATIIELQLSLAPQHAAPSLHSGALQ